MPSRSLAVYRGHHLGAGGGQQLGAADLIQPEGIGQETHCLQPRHLVDPRSRSPMARTLSPARSANASCERAAAIRWWRSSSPTGKGSALHIKLHRTRTCCQRADGASRAS